MLVFRSRCRLSGILCVITIQINEKMNQQNVSNYIDDQVVGKELLNKAPFAKPQRQQKVVNCYLPTHSDGSAMMIDHYNLSIP